MSDNKLEKSLFVSWIPLRHVFNPNKVKLTSTPVLKIVTDPDDHEHQHLHELQNNKFTFVGTDHQNICRLDQTLTPSHFQLSEEVAKQCREGTPFSKITIKFANVSASGYSVEILYHNDGFDEGVAAKFQKNVQFSQDPKYPRLLRSIPSQIYPLDLANTSSTSQNFALSKLLVDKLMGSKTEACFELCRLNQTQQSQQASASPKQDVQTHAEWILRQDGEVVDIPHKELSELCSFLFFRLRTTRSSNDGAPAFQIGSSLLFPPKDLRHLIVKDILHQYERRLRDAGMLDCDLQSIEPDDLVQIKYLEGKMSERYQTDPRLLSALYSLGSKSGFSLEAESNFNPESDVSSNPLQLCLAKCVQWFAYLKEDFLDDNPVPQKLSRPEPSENSQPKDELETSSTDHRREHCHHSPAEKKPSEVSSFYFLLVASIEPLLINQPPQTQELPVLPTLRTKTHIVRVSSGIPDSKFEAIPMTETHSESQAILSHLPKDAGSHDCNDIQISEGEFYLKDLTSNTLEYLPLEDILKPVPTDGLIPKVYQLDTLQPLCISKVVVAHVQKDLKRFGPTFTLKCSGYSTGQKQELILCKPSKELCKIEPVVSLQFFPKESWYCVAFSHCNLTMGIFLVKLDVPELTLTRFSFSSFTQQKLDPSSMFVNHVEKQKPIEGIPDMGEPAHERNKSVPKESTARFWMSRGRLFCMMSPRPGFIRLLGCNTKDFKFNILSQGGQSQRLGAYPLRLDQTLVPGYNGGTYLSLFTVRGNPLRTNRPKHYEIRRLRIKF